MSPTDSLSTPAKRTHDQVVALNRWSRQWLLAFSASVRTSQFHKTDNEIFDELVLKLNQTGNEIIALEGRADFRVLEDQFFLNGMWIKPVPSEKELFFALADTLKEQNMGGVTIRSSVLGDEWRTFFTILRNTFAPEQEKIAAINRELTKIGIEQISVTKPIPLAVNVERTLPLPLPAFTAVQTYGKALAALHDFSIAQPGEEQTSSLRKSQRVVCELVEIAEKHPRLLLALSLIKDFDSFFFHHSVNVSLLAILMGRTIELGRKELADLGMASLLHDVGKLRVPDDILNKASPLSEAEWTKVKSHPLESAYIFLTLGYLNTSVVERVLVAYQHHWASGLPEAYPQPRRTMLPSLMSQLVATAVTFDALTSDKPYRGSFTPYQGIRILAQESERGRYRKAVVQSFVNLMGPIPTGTWVKMDDGREGLVASAGRFAPHPPFPLVFVPNESSGTWVDTHDLLPSGKRPQMSAKRPKPKQTREAISGIFKFGEGFLF